MTESRIAKTGSSSQLSFPSLILRYQVKCETQEPLSWDFSERLDSDREALWQLGRFIHS